MQKYNPKKIESRWQKKWEKDNSFAAEDLSKKPKKYLLVEFPYPSGAGLHVGHVRSYTAMDVIARKSRMEEYNVMYPIGWDAFGLPTENYAIKHGIHPRQATKENIATFKRQLKSLGISYDWSREINTTDPEYYKWTQWIFLKFLEKGLAYKHKMPVNWCNSCKIVLANEEVVDGRCERCGGEVEKREKEQWMLKITEYADRLIDDLDEVDYLEKIKTQQKNWIGRSEGAEINFEINQKYNYVILHGYGATKNNSFYKWLKEELEKRGHKVQFPQLPNTENPNIPEQIEYVKKNIKFDENTILIAHSLGTVIAMKALEFLKKPIYKYVSVGGFITPEFLDNKRPFEKTFDWKYDFKKIKNNVGEVKILREKNDYAIPPKQADMVKDAIGGEIIDGEGEEKHFLGKVEPIVLDNSLEQLKVFTSRPDTIYGATYMVVAPEHEMISNYKSRITNYEEVKKYIDNAKKKSDLERTELQKDKTGVELKGIKAINPVNGEEIPIFVADYVLITYGTGAIMAVPAHDQRDFEFAKKYKLPINNVVASLFIDKTGKDAVRSDKKTVRRTVAYSFVKHWKEDKYLCLDWEKFNWHSGVIGGVEEGEDIIEAGKREITEETGYKNLKLIKKLPGEFHSNFYAEHKGVNRYAEGHGLLFELKDGEKAETKEEDTKNHKAVWIDKDEMTKFLNLENNIIMWNMLISGEEVFTEDGVSINSKIINDLKTIDAKKKITKWLEKNNYGKKSVNYKLRDWIFSRQHYWGEPIPVIHCESCGTVPVPEEDLPVELPDVEKYEPTETGESPLAAIKDWVNVKCPKCSGDAKRETDTMPNWAGSSWYYLRYCDPKNNKDFADQKKLKYFMPVDWYNGGMEHTTLHLLYSRFWHKFLYDQGLVPTLEPYQKRTSHGMVLAEDGRKMSKSFGNVINPDEIVENAEGGGADTLRLYELFMGPFSEAIPWSMDGVKGIRRFLEKVWSIFSEKELIDCGGGCKGVPENLPTLLHQTIKKVTEDIESMDFNTAISQMMIFINEVYKHDQVPRGAMERFLVLLSPFAPHLAEELWENLGNKESITAQEWPTYNEKMLAASEINLIIQVNGKVRDTLKLDSGLSEKEALDVANKSEKVKKYINDQDIKKVIYIQDKILNLVV